MFRSRMILMIVAVSLTGAACGDDGGADSVAPLDAPSGECTQLTYTPPSAAQPMDGILCRPEAGAEQFGGIVLVHGGGGTSGTPVDVASWEAAYREAGMTTFSPEYRIHEPASGSATWPIPESNVKAAVQFMRAHGEELGLEDVVFLHGFSAGARLGGIVTTTPGDGSFPEDELWSGVSDEVTSFIGFYGYYDGQQFEQDTYYENGTIPPAAVAIDHAAAVTGPVQLTHGDADPLVPVEQSSAFAEALEEAGKEVNLTLVPGASHVFDGYRSADITPEGADAADKMVEWYESLMASSD